MKQLLFRFKDCNLDFQIQLMLDINLLLYRRNRRYEKQLALPLRRSDIAVGGEKVVCGKTHFLNFCTDYMIWMKVRFFMKINLSWVQIQFDSGNTFCSIWHRILICLLLKQFQKMLEKEISFEWFC